MLHLTIKKILNKIKKNQEKKMEIIAQTAVIIFTILIAITALIAIILLIKILIQAIIDK